MTIVIHDPLRFYVGDQWVMVFPCANPDGTPLDLTGASAQWRLDDFDGNTLLTKTTSDALTILTPPTGGLVGLTLDDTDTEVIVPGYYQDQLRVTTSDGATTTQSSGRIEALASLFVEATPAELPGGEP